MAKSTGCCFWGSEFAEIGIAGDLPPSTLNVWFQNWFDGWLGGDGLIAGNGQRDKSRCTDGRVQRPENRENGFFLHIGTVILNICRRPVPEQAYLHRGRAAICRFAFSERRVYDRRGSWKVRLRVG